MNKQGKSCENCGLDDQGDCLNIPQCFGRNGREHIYWQPKQPTGQGKSCDKFRCPKCDKYPATVKCDKYPATVRSNGETGICISCGYSGWIDEFMQPKQTGQRGKKPLTNEEAQKLFDERLEKLKKGEKAGMFIDTKKTLNENICKDCGKGIMCPTDCISKHYPMLEKYFNEQALRKLESKKRFYDIGDNDFKECITYEDIKQILGGRRMKQPDEKEDIKISDEMMSSKGVQDTLEDLDRQESLQDRRGDEIIKTRHLIISYIDNALVNHNKLNEGMISEEQYSQNYYDLIDNMKKELDTLYTKKIIGEIRVEVEKIEIIKNCQDCQGYWGNLYDLPCPCKENAGINKYIHAQLTKILNKLKGGE